MATLRLALSGPSGAVPSAALQLGPVAADRDGARRSERRLIRAAQDGSEEALEQIFRRHWPLAHRAAYLVVHDSASAEDIAQEAFLAAIRSLDRFDRRRPFGPWLHRIVVNRAIDWSRAQRLRGEVATESQARRADREEAGSIPGGPPISEEVVTALAQLDPERRGIVVLRHLLEFTPGEIAAALELPRGTVNSRLRRGLDQLRELLGDEA